jgi:Zn-dependent peptidase ImmA (M78 family)
MAVVEAEKAARDLLRTAWSSNEPAAFPVPVDPIKIARQLGIDVYEARLRDDNVAGMIIKDAGRDPEIYLNVSDSPNRKRFSCAHELGHYVKHAGDDGDEFEYVDYRNRLSSQGTDPDEMFANSFAAELLMPENVVRYHSQEFGRAALASIFEVSLEAMGHRMRNLGLS